MEEEINSKTGLIINLDNSDMVIKFRTLNRDYNYIFLKVRNSIQIYDPIRLNLIYSFYVKEPITNFEISPKDSSLVVNTTNKIELSELITNNLSDYEIKIKYSTKYSKNIENIESISISPLGDIIVVIDKHRLIKILNINLEIVKNVKVEMQFFPSNLNLFPLEYFRITYDTKNICICKYKNYNVSLIYKNINTYNSSEEVIEYSEKIIKFKDKIIYLKEMQKEFLNYLNFPNSSIFFLLLENLNFLILRKTIECDEQGQEHPDFTILIHLDISTYTEYINFPFISFSLLYDNENPNANIYHNKNNSQLDYKSSSALSQLRSAIHVSDLWYDFQSKNILESENNILNLKTYHHRDVSEDYIIFNMKESLVLYKINGLSSHPYNNLRIELYANITTDINFNNQFLLLKFCKTRDRKYCVYLINSNNLIRKFQFDSNNNRNLKNILTPKLSSNNLGISVFDSEKSFKIYSNIIQCEFNEKNKKTLILEYNQINTNNHRTSVITILNSKLEFSRMIIFKGFLVKNLKWIEHTDFFIFSFHDDHAVDNCCNTRIAIIYFFSKFLNKIIIDLDELTVKEKFILINPQENCQKFEEHHKNELHSHTSHLKYIQIDSICKFDNTNSNVKFDLLLISDESLVITEISIQKYDKLDSENILISEFESSFKVVNSFPIEKSSNLNYLRNMVNSFVKGHVVFHKRKIYYPDNNNSVFAVKMVDEDVSTDHNTIFQVILLEELLYSNVFFNNYIIFISNEYVNCYDVSTATFYRVRNDHLKKYMSGPASSNQSIDLFKFGIFVYLVIITNDKILCIRIPFNKNNSEEIKIDFESNFEINNSCARLMNNSIIVLNESQILKLSDISKNENERKFLFMINSNPNSIFDMETFLNFLLSNNDDIIKLILNIFCQIYNDMGNIIHNYTTAKMIPNFYKLENIDNIIKIIFDNNMVVNRNSNNTVENSEHIIEAGGNDEDHFYTANYSPVDADKPNPILINNAKPILKFKSEEDNLSTNPINIITSKNSQLLHLKSVYEVISSESTRNLDNFTKYFILKIMYNLENENFKLSTADLCWINMINDQEYLLKFLSKSYKITWKFMKTFSVPLWIKNEYKLRELFETVGKLEYKYYREQGIKGDSLDKNVAENVALYYYLANKHNIVFELFDKEQQNIAVRKFIMRDFSIEKNRRLAQKNAGDLIDKKKYIFAAYFFLLADDIQSALDMTLVYMKDFNLTISIMRLYQSPYGNTSWQKYYSIEKLYQEYFIDYGLVIRDPWLVVYGLISQNKIDLAFEYMLKYDLRYKFDPNKIIDSDDYSQIILEWFTVNVFDYKLLLFAKHLEKIYKKILDDSKFSVKSVQNTNFEDIWGMDEEEEQTQSNDNVNEVKHFEIDYSNLSYLSLVNCFKCGILFSPILSLYAENSQLDPYCTELLKTLICDRVALDTNFVNNESDDYFKDIERLFHFIESRKMLNIKHIYKELNKIFLFLDNYKQTAIPCIKSDKVSDSLLSLTNCSEKLIFRHLSILVNFNFNENLNLSEINVKMIVKIREMNEFVIKIVKNINDSYSNYTNNDIIGRFRKMEINLYVFRIYFMFFVYLMFVSKILMLYNKVSIIMKLLHELLEDYKRLDKFNEACNKYSVSIELISLKLSKKISKYSNKSLRPPAVSFFIQILNISILTSLKNIISDNIEITGIPNTFKELNLLRLKDCENSKNVNNIYHYIQEQFIFISQLIPLTDSFIDNFPSNFEKYIKNYVDVTLLWELHEELKLIYMKNLIQETNFYKYSLISIKMLFKNQNKLKTFEDLFQLKKCVLKYMSKVSKYVKYEREVDMSTNTNSGAIDINVPHDFLKYSKESIRIINQLFKNGVDVANFAESYIIHDFAINNCNFSNFAVAMMNNGHRKINILNNLLIRRRSEGILNN